MDSLRLALEYEFVQAIACALHHEWRLGTAWELSESGLRFLEEHENFSDIPLPGLAVVSISQLVTDHRRVLSLLSEYFLERLDYQSQARVRWVNHDKRGNFVKVSECTGARQGGYPVVRVTRAASSTREARGGSSRDRVWLETVLTDSAIRSIRGGREVLDGFTEREGGWSIRELLDQTARLLRDDDDKISYLRDESSWFERENEVLRVSKNTLRRTLADLRDAEGREHDRARQDSGLGIYGVAGMMPNPYMSVMQSAMPYGYPSMPVMPYQGTGQAAQVASRIEDLYARSDPYWESRNRVHEQVRESERAREERGLYGYDEEPEYTRSDRRDREDQTEAQRSRRDSDGQDRTAPRDRTRRHRDPYEEYLGSSLH